MQVQGRTTSTMSSSGDGGRVTRARGRIPPATIGRLLSYLRVAEHAQRRGVPILRSGELAEAANCNADSVRRDLWVLGVRGVRGQGYSTRDIVAAGAANLFPTGEVRVAISGAGMLGSAIARYPRLPEHGFKIVAVFDTDEDLVGRQFGAVEISGADETIKTCLERQVDVGVITTPPSGAQRAADSLIAGGATALLNFAPVSLTVPPDVILRPVDLLVEFAVLASLHERHV